MRWLWPIPILIGSAGWLWPAAVQGAQSAPARLFCQSLRFDKATNRQFGQTFTLELTSIPVEPGNGEWSPLFDPELPSHGSLFILRDPAFGGEPVTGSIAFDVPPFMDANANGFHDFFESSQDLSTTVTRGIFATDIDDGDVTATWSRAAGSASGTCTLRLVGATFGRIPDFTHTFHLLEYTGAAEYSATQAGVTARAELARTGDSSTTLSGTIELAKTGTNRFDELDLSSGTLTNQSAQVLSYANSTILRDPLLETNYFGLIEFADGEPPTPEADYLFWVLSIDDSHDRDGDGIPDFSDDPPENEPDPGLELRRSAGRLHLLIHGTMGATYDLEETATLAARQWSPTRSVTLTNQVQSIELETPAGPTIFWRLRRQ